METASKIVILYGSQTYTAQEIAERIWRTTKILEMKGPVQAMDDYPIFKLIHEEYALFVCATTGNGDEPDNMKAFWKFLLRKNLPSNSLLHLKFGVIGLGDSSYNKFNFAAKKLQKRLIQLGGQPLLDAALCDYQHDLGHDAVLIPWLQEFYKKLKPTMEIDPNVGATKFVPRWKTTIMKNNIVINDNGLTQDMYFGSTNTDHFVHPIYLDVENNSRTTLESHFQDVRLIAFKTVNDEKNYYCPGDVLNIRPRNSKEDIDDLFEIFKTHNIDIKPCYILNVEKYHEGKVILICKGFKFS